MRVLPTIRLTASSPRLPHAASSSTTQHTEELLESESYSYTDGSLATGTAHSTPTRHAEPPLSEPYPGPEAERHALTDGIRRRVAEAAAAKEFAPRSVGHEFMEPSRQEGLRQFALHPPQRSPHAEAALAAALGALGAEPAAEDQGSKSKGSCGQA